MRSKEMRNEPPPPPDDRSPAAGANVQAQPVRKPWVPPRFKGVEADLFKAGHTYYDYDDSHTVGSAKTCDIDGHHPNYDQTNPYNS